MEVSNETSDLYLPIYQHVYPNSNKNLPFKEAHEYKVCTRSGHAAVCKISANELLGLALHVRREKAAMFLKSALQ